MTAPKISGFYLHEVTAVKVIRETGGGYPLVAIEVAGPDGEIIQIRMFTEGHIEPTLVLEPLPAVDETAPPTPSATEEPPRSTDPVEEVDDDIPF